MTRLVRIELLKLRTVRLPAALLVTAAGLTALFACVEASQAGRPGGSVGSLATAAGLRSVTMVTGWAMLLAALLGVTISTGEFRHATATLTYLATPVRGRVLAAKAVAAACAGALFGLVAAVIATGVGLGFAAARGDHGAHGARFALGAGTSPPTRQARSWVRRCWPRSGSAWVAGPLPARRGCRRVRLGADRRVAYRRDLHVGPALPAVHRRGHARRVQLGVGPGGFRVAVRMHAMLCHPHCVAVAMPDPGPLPFAAAAALLAGTVIVVAMLAELTTVRRDVT